MIFSNKLDKSKGYAFTIDKPWLDYPVEFYHGLYSPGSYAGKYRGEIIYLSGIGCKLFKYGRDEYASLKLFEQFHSKDRQGNKK